MPLLRFRRAPFALNPAVISTAVWLFTGVLYALHLSGVLLFNMDDLLQALALIMIPPIFVSLAFWVVYTSQKKGEISPTVVVEQPRVEMIERRVRQATWLWAAMAVVETIVSGGLPIIWIVTGNPKTYADYGVPSIHGVVNSLLLAILVTSMALYLYTGKRKHLVMPALGVVWFVTLVTRGTIVFLLAECLIVLLRMRRIRWASIVRLGLAAGALVLIFGFAGDVRSGADAFRSLAQPTADYPDWAPSGFLWVYIYVTTPINNLIYSMHLLQPVYSPLLPNTAATLFPTVIRNLVYGQAAGEAVSGSLVTEAFNVSTAYVAPFQDLGRAGIVGFSALSAFLCEYFRRRDGFRNILISAVFGETLILSLFFNLLFSLPILGQIVWFFLFTYQSAPKPKANAAALEAQHA